MKFTTAIIGVLGVAAGAFAVWGVVRLINRGTPPRKRILAGIGLTLALSYPLSFGPYMRLVVEKQLSPAVGRIFYGPLFWLTEKTGTESWLDWYVSKWVPPRPEILWDNGVESRVPE